MVLVALDSASSDAPLEVVQLALHERRDGEQEQSDRWQLRNDQEALRRRSGGELQEAITCTGGSASTYASISSNGTLSQKASSRM